MNKGLISVIVPIYNKQDCLEKCIASIQRQSYKNIEILLVDDGSTDNSFEIAASIASADARIKLFKKSNGGVSSARNEALDNATGSYITFVDADDWIENDFLKDMLEFAVQNNAEIICSNFTFDKVVDGKLLQVTPNQVSKVESYNVDDVCHEITKIYDRKIGWENCSKLFSKKAIHNVKYDEDITNGEDWLFFCKTLKNIEHLAITPITGYHYVYMSNSASNMVNKSYVSACIASERSLNIGLPFTSTDIDSIKESIAQTALMYSIAWKNKKGVDVEKFAIAYKYYNEYKRYAFISQNSSFRRKIKFFMRSIYLKFLK